MSFEISNTEFDTYKFYSSITILLFPDLDTYQIAFSFTYALFKSVQNEFYFYIILNPKWTLNKNII